MKLKTLIGTSFKRKINITLDLFDSLINPILLYSSDFWGCLKQVLGIQKQTTNIGVFLELGRIPIDTFAKQSAINNWEGIRLKWANSILLASYNDAILEKLLWISSIKDLLESKGMLSLFINSYESTPPFIYKKLSQTLTDEFHQNSFENIRREDAKLRTYAGFKTEIGQERYLTEIKNPFIRTEMTKFRLSNHDLSIETGRHKNLPKDQRFCPFCPKEVETEVHFLLLCPTYDISRALLLRQLNACNHFFQFYTLNEIFNYLLSNIENYDIYISTFQNHLK